MVSEYPKMNQQHTAGKIKHTALTVPQISHTIRKLESGECQRQVMASYNIRSSTNYDIRNRKTNYDQL